MEEAYQNLSICSEGSCRSANNLITDVAHDKKASSTESTNKRPAYLKRCPLDLPGFKNLEGLPIGLTPGPGSAGTTRARIAAFVPLSLRA